MKNILVHILNSVLLITILVSTTGITIHTHQCSKNNIKKTSLFESGIYCEHQYSESHHDCDNCNTSCDLHNPDCCHDYEQTYILTLNIEVQHYSPESKPLCILSLDNIITANNDLEHYNDINKPDDNFRLPHPHTGKQKVLLYRNIKIPPLPVC